MQLPTLYKITSTGAKQEWTIKVEHNRYWTLSGQTGGRMTMSAVTRCVSKQGRTDDQQAKFEASALWVKKQKKDYTLDLDVKASQPSEEVKNGKLLEEAYKTIEELDCDLNAAIENMDGPSCKLLAELADVRADRDSWKQQCDDRVADVLRIGAERDLLKRQVELLCGELSDQEIFYDGAPRDSDGWYDWSLREAKEGC